MSRSTHKPKYVHVFTDRQGKIRRYFRRKGRKQVPLPGKPGSTEFMGAYNAAIRVSDPRPKLWWEYSQEEQKFWERLMNM